MNSVKRIIAVFLSVLMLVSVIPLAVTADYATELEKDAEGYYLINTLEEADSLLCSPGFLL